MFPIRKNLLFLAIEIGGAHLNFLPAGKVNAQNPRNVANMQPKVEGDCGKLRRSYEEFFGSTERELSRDSIYVIFERSPFVSTSSLSPRIFQIDVLEHSVFVKYFLCRMNRD